MFRSTVSRLARSVRSRRPSLAAPSARRRGRAFVETLEARIAPATLAVGGGTKPAPDPGDAGDHLASLATLPTVSVAVTAHPTVLEDEAFDFGGMTFTFTRAGVTTGAVTANFTLTGTVDFFDDINAIAFGGDGGSSNGTTLGFNGHGTLNFGDGETTKFIRLDFDHDKKVEPDETAIMTVTSGTGYTVAGSPATGTVINDDTDVTLSVSPTSVIENAGGSPLTYTFTRSGVTTNALTVNFTAGGTASSGDYVLAGAAGFAANAGTVTFLANATTAMVTVAPVGDALLEGNETVILTVAPATGSDVYNAGSSKTGTIVDDELDFGDAPDTYGTTLAANGARHIASPTFHLGPTVDSEADGQPNGSASGDGADEDGVTLPGSLFTGHLASITVNASQAGKLDAFIDWNRDGDFNDAGEKIFDNVSLQQGDNALTISVPGDARIGNSIARFRLSSDGGHGPTGLAADGEVEDYAVTIAHQDVSVAAT